MTNSFKRPLIYFLFGFILSSQNAFCSFYANSTEALEEIEYSNALSLVKKASKEGFKKLNNLALQGNLKAFRALNIFYEAKEWQNYEPFIDNVYSTLVNKKKYADLVMFGNCLKTFKKNKNAYFFLDEVLSNKNMLSNNLLISASYTHAQLEKELLQTVPEEIKKIVLDQLLNLCTLDSRIIPYFKKFGVQNFLSLPKSKHEEFAKDLIYDFEKSLFQFGEIKNVWYDFLIHTSRILYSKSGKQNFLINVIFPKMKENHNKLFDEMSEKIIYNRMILVANKNKEEWAKMLSGLDVKDEENIFLICLGIQLNYHEYLFPKNDGEDEEDKMTPLDAFMVSLNTKEKHALITFSLKKIIKELGVTSL